MDDDIDVEKQNRVLLRPWLENMLETQSIPGLEWFDDEKTMFKIPWKHRSKKDWSMRHSSVFLEWARNTGRWSEGDPPPNFAQLKTRLRCAFNKAPDIDEMKEHHCSKGEEPFKVYRFNTRRVDTKSVPGRKICQKTIGRPGQTTGSPTFLKYESCEEEVVDDDDNAIYGEIEIHSSTFSSGDGTSGLGKVEIGNMEMDQKNYLSSVSGAAVNDRSWLYGDRALLRGAIGDSRSPVIPLTVEMMTSSSPNDDSDCDGESPKNLWQNSADRSVPLYREDNNVLQTIKSEVSNENLHHHVKANENFKPVADDSADKMHLLQMASLFVEAAERKKEKDIQMDDKITESTAVSINCALPQYSPGQYMIIMPSNCELENPNEGSVTSGYVTPTSTDVIDVKLPLEEPLEEPYGSKMPTDNGFAEDKAVDLTKSTVLVKSSAATEILRSNSHISSQARTIGCLDNGSVEAGKAGAPLDSSVDHSVDHPVPYSTGDMLMPLSEQATLEQMKQYLNKLREWSRQLMERETRLQSWENQLQAKEETLYWRDRCFQNEFGINSADARPQNCHRSKALIKSCDAGQTSLASLKPSLQLKDLLTLTSSAAGGSLCSSTTVSSGILSSAGPVITKAKAESQSKLLSLRNNSAKSSSSSLVKEQNGKLDGEHVILSNSHSLTCGGSKSESYVHSVPVMSLIGSNQAVQLSVPLLIGSQSIMLVPQHLMPLASMQPVTPDAGILIKNHLESQSTTGGEIVAVPAEKPTSLKPVDELEPNKSSPESKTTVLPVLQNVEKPDCSADGISCLPADDLQSLTSESTVEKPAAALVRETDQKRATASSVTSSDCPQEPNVSRNCSAPNESEQRTVVFNNALPEVIASFPQVSLSAAGVGQTAAMVCGKSPIDFTSWLRAKTEIICKEESLEVKKCVEETENPSVLCSERDSISQCSSKSELKIQMLNQDDSVNEIHSDQNFLPPPADARVFGPTPILTSQVPLVVENENDLLEKDLADDNVSKRHLFARNNLVKRRKRSYEKQNSFKKVRVDA